MSDLRFRNIQGMDDAVALIRIHTLCNEIEGAAPGSLEEYRPTPAWYEKNLNLLNPADWILAEMDGTVVGYGQTRWNWAERDGAHVFFHASWVAPQWRGKGIGTPLVNLLEARCREKALHTRAAYYEFGAGSSDRERDTCLRLESNGYTLAYTSWEMALEPACLIEVAPLPDGYHLRPVTLEQHQAIWQCIGDAYDVSCPSGRFTPASTEEGFDGHFRSKAADPTLWFVAWQGSRVAGQVLCRVHAHCGEVFEVSIGYGHRRRGLARALLTRGIAALRQRGVGEIRLGTRYEYPTQAWQLYEQVGFRRVGVFPRWRKPFDLPPIF
jgi:ribosomal protein S18 acetylase RimI-like enzyme